MSIKNIILNGKEKVSSIGDYACIKNNGTEKILACIKQGLSEGNDGTVIIQPGESIVFPCVERSLELYGNSEVTVIGSDAPVNFFKPSSTGGGVTKEYVNSVRYADNLLTNPDFAINQRGQSSYTITGNTVDCWLSQSCFEIMPLESGVRICCADAITSNVFALYQQMTVSSTLHGSDLTLTANIASTNEYAYMVIYAYNSAGTVIKSSDKIKLQNGLNSVSIKNLPETTAHVRTQFTINSGAQSGDVLEIKWAKLEIGSERTMFGQVDAANELLKCQRYYQIRSTGDIPAVDLRPVMAGTPKVDKRSDGNYAYSV